MNGVLHRSAAIVLSAVAVALLAGGCGASDREAGSVTPAGLDGNEMYGQGDMTWVIEHIAVFRTRTDLISPDREAVRFLNNLRQPVTIMVFMGSWNVDAQIHVPALFATMREVDNNRITLKVIGLNQRLEDRDGLAARYEITASPTFVVRHRDIEIGRIIQTPTSGAAADIVAIIRTAVDG